MDFLFITGWPKGEGTGGLNEFAFNKETGELTHLRTIDENVAFGTAFAGKEPGILYAVNEKSGPDGGNVYTYKVDPKNGDIRLLGITSTLVANPAYLGVDKTGKYAVVADHSTNDAGVKVELGDDGKYHPVVYRNDAIVALFGINGDGSLGGLCDVSIHEGSSIGKRQDMPHPHCAVFSPDGSLIAVCDKGTDYVHMYTIDEEQGRLKEVTKWKETPGYMPRYAAFHPTKPFFYHNNEGNAIVSAYSYDEKAVFTQIGEFCAAPNSWDGKVEQQGLCIHPSGKYLYDCVKGPEAITVFEIDQENGSLKKIQSLLSDYMWIRTVQTSPDGRFLCATYKDSDKAVIYEINERGMLEETGIECDCIRAAGIAFM